MWIGKQREFKVLKEDYSIYELDDGTIIRVKKVVTEIWDTGRKDSLGRPVFMTVSKDVLAVCGPKE